MWTNYFDHIVLINLPNRKDRMLKSMESLMSTGIVVDFVEPAIQNQNGQHGVYDTLIRIFNNCLNLGAKNVLVFEDDVKIINSNISDVMNKVVTQIPEYWHMLYLGANLPDPTKVSRYSDNLLLTKRALALHSVAYSREAMEMIIALPRMLPIDLQITNWIAPLGHTYVTYPLLCSQEPGYSDIEKRHTDYKGYIEDRYDMVIQHLNLKP